MYVYIHVCIYREREGEKEREREIYFKDMDYGGRQVQNLQSGPSGWRARQGRADIIAQDHLLSDSFFLGNINILGGR